MNGARLASGIVKDLSRASYRIDVLAAALRDPCQDGDVRAGVQACGESQRRAQGGGGQVVERCLPFAGAWDATQAWTVFQGERGVEEPCIERDCIGLRKSLELLLDVPLCAHHPMRTPVLTLLLLGLAASCSRSEGGAPSGESMVLAPVAVGQVETRPITLRRTFSGALEAASEVTVAPRVSGHLKRLAVNIGDSVTRGQVVAWIDDAEWEQAVLQARAELAVARANVKEASAAAEIAERTFERIERLRKDGVASESEMDTARTAALARRSRVSVTDAQVQRADAALAAAEIRLAQATVKAEWDGADDGARVVARRFVDEGANVSAGTPMLSIVGLQPMLAVVFVPERDYARLAPGQVAQIVTDAYPGETFSGTVARVAPVFSQNTRQVRVELEVANEDLRLKPGMFVRAMLELGADEGATVVPYDALTRRGDVLGVFVVDRAGDLARWRPVRAGIREGAAVQVFGDGVSGRVVTLGQELCDDGAPVRVIDSATGESVGGAGSSPGDL